MEYWNNGVMEYWSDRSDIPTLHHSITPVLHSPMLTVELTKGGSSWLVISKMGVRCLFKSATGGIRVFESACVIKRSIAPSSTGAISSISAMVFRASSTGYFQ